MPRPFRPVSPVAAPGGTVAPGRLRGPVGEWPWTR